MVEKGTKWKPSMFKWNSVKWQEMVRNSKIVENGNVFKYSVFIWNTL